MKPFLAVDVDQPIKCSFRFPFLVTYPEKYAPFIKYSDGIYYTSISRYYDVVKYLGLAPKNPRKVKWVNDLIRPLPVSSIRENAIHDFRVQNLYEYASLLYRLSQFLEYGYIVVLTKYPEALYTDALGEFMTATSDTLVVVKLSELFKAGRLGLSMLLPIYALLLDPSIEPLVKDIIEEVYGFFGAKVALRVEAPGGDLLATLPARLSEYREIAPQKAMWIARREHALSKMLKKSGEVRAVLFEELKILP